MRNTARLLLKVGDKVRLQFPRLDSGRQNFNNKLYHYRGRVDDKLVLRYWSRAKQDWCYEIMPLCWETMYAEYLTVERSKLEKLDART